MELVARIFTVLIFAPALVVEASSEDDGIRRQLEALTEQVMLQNEQLNKIISGFSDLWSAVMEYKCPCRSTNDTLHFEALHMAPPGPKVTEIHDDPPHPVDTVSDVVLLSVQSRKLTTSHLIIFISYTARNTSTGHCSIYYANRYKHIGSGVEEVKASGTEEVVYHRVSFLVEKNQDDIIRDFSCIISGQVNNVYLSFNASLLFEPFSRYVFTENISDIFMDLTPSFELTNKTNHTLHLFFKNFTEPRSAHSSYMWLDERSRTSRVLRENGVPKITTSLETGISELVEQIPESVILGGGVLYLTVYTRNILPTFLIRIVNQYQINIIAQGRSSPLFEGHVGIVPLPGASTNTIYVQSIGGSVQCSALGNPALSIEMFRFNSDGTMTGLNADSYNTGEYRITITASIEENGGLDNFEGKYVCIANSTIQRADRVFGVERGVTPQVRAQTSGVLHNGTDKIVIVCEASGNPIPQLDFRANEIWSNVFNGTFKEDTVDVRSHVVRSVLTIKPVRLDIWRIYCRAWSSQGISEDYEIEILQKPKIDYVDFDTFENETWRDDWFGLL